MAKSNNKHNRLHFESEPLSTEVLEAIEKMEIS
jgi:hypothetical protein